MRLSPQGDFGNANRASVGGKTWQSYSKLILQFQFECQREFYMAEGSLCTYLRWCRSFAREAGIGKKVPKSLKKEKKVMALLASVMGYGAIYIVFLSGENALDVSHCNEMA
jgi:hypothetical protein